MDTTSECIDPDSAFLGYNDRHHARVQIWKCARESVRQLEKNTNDPVIVSPAYSPGVGRQPTGKQQMLPTMTIRADRLGDFPPSKTHFLQYCGVHPGKGEEEEYYVDYYLTKGSAYVEVCDCLEQTVEPSSQEKYLSRASALPSSSSSISSSTGQCSWRIACMKSRPLSCICETDEKEILREKKDVQEGTQQSTLSNDDDDDDDDDDDEKLISLSTRRDPYSFFLNQLVKRSHRSSRNMDNNFSKEEEQVIKRFCDVLQRMDKADEEVDQLERTSGSRAHSHSESQSCVFSEKFSSTTIPSTKAKTTNNTITSKKQSIPGANISGEANTRENQGRWVYTSTLDTKNYLRIPLHYGIRIKPFKGEKYVSLFAESSCASSLQKRTSIAPLVDKRLVNADSAIPNATQNIIKAKNLFECRVIHQLHEETIRCWTWGPQKMKTKTSSFGSFPCVKNSKQHSSSSSNSNTSSTTKTTMTATTTAKRKRSDSEKTQHRNNNSNPKENNKARKEQRLTHYSTCSSSQVSEHRQSAPSISTSTSSMTNCPSTVVFSRPYTSSTQKQGNSKVVSSASDSKIAHGTTKSSGSHTQAIMDQAETNTVATTTISTRNPSSGYCSSSNVDQASSDLKGDFSRNDQRNIPTSCSNLSFTTQSGYQTGSKHIHFTSSTSSVTTMVWSNARNADTRTTQLKTTVFPSCYGYQRKSSHTGTSSRGPAVATNSRESAVAKVLSNMTAFEK
jgi:hypothetical protein